MNDINELAKALSLAQIEMNGAFKDAKNPFFKSNYADLKQVMQVFQTYYAPKGLAVAQLVTGKCLKTILMHTSGQSISSEGEIPIAKANDPQAFGSALTYMRRYTLAAIIGCYQTDDDAELAMGRTETPKIDSKPITPKPILTPKEHVKVATAQLQGDIDPCIISADYNAWVDNIIPPPPIVDTSFNYGANASREEMSSEIKELRKKLNWTVKQLSDFIDNAFQKQSKDLTNEEMEVLIDNLSKFEVMS